jgi:hypothetical protein
MKYMAYIAELPSECQHYMPGLLARIEERLRVLGKSAYTASLEAGLGEDAIRDLRRGGNKSPRVEAIAQLAVALEVPASWLAFGQWPKGYRQRRPRKPVAD